jgi:GT2 family glycosyltransferase
LHGLTERDFPKFDYKFMHINGDIRSNPTIEIANLLVMTWQKGKEYKDNKRILCSIPTKNRYDALMNCLQSVAFQTVRPDKVIIYDDGEHKDLREHPMGRYILPLLDLKGIEWETVFLSGRGQHIAHQMANTSGYDLVWRLDDDTVAEPDVLERLLAHMDDGVGAVGGAVYEIDRKVYGGTSKIEDFFDGGNVQWAPDQGIHEVDFLYSSFLYRTGIANYKQVMSPAAFHEETIFTHRIKRAGYKLIADTTIKTFHFKCPSGGTRVDGMEWAYAFDNKEFMNLMEKEFGIKLITLGNGLGDHYSFKQILPELIKKYNKVIIGCACPEVFEGDDVKIISYADAKRSSDDNVYNWMMEHGWKGHIVDAFREMYLK